MEVRVKNVLLSFEIELKLKSPEYHMPCFMLIMCELMPIEPLFLELMLQQICLLLLFSAVSLLVVALSAT